MDYLDWNNRLASHFFGPDHSGRRVFLFITEDLINELGSPNSVDDFITAVKTGPPWIERGGLCQRAVETMNGWRDRNLAFPPYIAYLGLFVLAAGHGGEFHPRSYYPRLREMLGENPQQTGMYPGFGRMYELWDDLETWANEDRNEELGTFRAHIQGNKIHIGLPLSQTFFSSEDIQQLHRIFFETHLDPLDRPADLEVIELVRRHGAHSLRQSTQRMLDVVLKGQSDLREAIAEVIQEELASWDGQVDLAAESSTKSAVVAICLRNIDPIVQSVVCELRCRSAEQLPDDGLRLENEEVSMTPLSCNVASTHWSEPLSINGVTVAGGELDWLSSYQLSDSSYDWRCRFIGRPVRILTSGRPEGLPGWVEQRRLVRNTHTLILAHDSVAPEIAAWGESDCVGFKQIVFRAGLPSDWYLYELGDVTSSRAIERQFRYLALPLSTKLRIGNAVKAGVGQVYFQFAPPVLDIESEHQIESVHLDSRGLPPDQDWRSYEISAELCVVGSHQLSVHAKGEDVSRRFRILDESTIAWREASCDASYDEYGHRAGNANGVLVSGAVVRGAGTVSDFPFSAFLETSHHRRVIFIGAYPGQFIDWPSEGRPVDWSPVWAIPMRRRGEAIYCGSSFADAAPSSDSRGDARAVRSWKQTLWHWRKKIKAPSNSRLASLWEAYVEVARRV